MQNITIIQFFHWYYPNDKSLWKHCREQAPFLERLGFTHTWLPPACKSANGDQEPGYAVYDLFDLGEFDQKGSVPTKYGTKQEFIDCVQTLHKHHIQVLADVVLNHRMGGDETELIKVKQVNNDDRTKMNGNEEVIEFFTKFTFPGRQKKYSDFIWDFHCFSGIGIVSGEGPRIYKILNENGDSWDEMPGKEKGNYDYLMGCDIDFRNTYVREEMKWWGKWFIETTGVNGFRLDAVKHMSMDFVKEWIHYLKDTFQKELFCIGELSTDNTGELQHWLQTVEENTQLFDQPLHYNFYEASLKKAAYSLPEIFKGSLLKCCPERSVTFVDNHDSQPVQGKQFVEYWFKPLAYALILLRQEGIPCVFYPSVYSVTYEVEKEGENFSIELVAIPAIREMLLTRKELAYGAQQDYFDHPNVIGWVRQGAPEKEHSGIAVVISNSDEGFKKMDMGEWHAQKTFVDITGNRQEKIITDEKGEGEFKVNGESVSVWVREEAAGMVTI